MRLAGQSHTLHPGLTVRYDGISCRASQVGVESMNILRVIVSACLISASVSTCAMNPRQRALNALEEMRAEQYFANPIQANFVTAIGRSDLDAAKQWLAQGAAVNAVGNDGLSPLIWAMLKQQISAVEFLLREGADPNLVTRWTNDRGREEWASPLSLASKFEDQRFLKALLAKDADPNLIVNAVGETALYTAILHKRLQNMELLITSGADVNHRSQFGHTPISNAAYQRGFGAVLVLLKSGADPSLESSHGFSAIAAIKEFGNRGVVIGSADAAAYPELIAELKRRRYLPD